jgi:PTS system cellobiose-specific IIB component
MKNVVFICLMGMSTSMLVQKVEKAAKEKGMEMNISAMSEAEAMRQAGNIDAILLGPQVRYLLPQFQKKFVGQNVKVEVIDTKAYGLMDGKAVLEQITHMVSE